MLADNHDSTQDQDDEDDNVMRRCVGRLYRKAPNHPVWGDNPDDRLYMFVGYEHAEDAYCHYPDKVRRVYFMKCISSDGEPVLWSVTAKAFIEGGYFIEVNWP